MTLKMPPSLMDWVADSNASNHTTPDPGNISLFRPPNPAIIVGNRSILHVTSVGDTVLLRPFYLNNVLVTPDILRTFLPFINLPLTIGVQWNLTLLPYL
jgi:hypothetical protein